LWADEYCPGIGAKSPCHYGKRIEVEGDSTRCRNNFENAPIRDLD
jgi:hypothetical protein